LTKQKKFKDKPRIQSNSGKLTNWLTTEAAEPIVISDSNEPIIIREEEQDETIDMDQIPEAGENQDAGSLADAAEAENDGDKKKLAMNTSYEGFSIYGRILCLVVKQKGTRHQAAPATSQQMLENWVSTQAAAEQVDDDDEG
jgi:hypothetical protein